MAGVLKLLLKPIKTIKKFSLLGKTSFIVILLILLVAIFAPCISIHPYNVSSGPPLSPPGGEHPLGTDELGIDLWAQICYGARVSLLVGFLTALLAALGGGLIGIVSGYLGGWTDKILMRIIDIMIVLPDLPVMIVMAAFFGPSLLNIILVLALFSWVFPARIVRSQVLMLKEQGYIKSAETYGAGAWYLIHRHFLPEVFPLVAVNMVRLTGRAVVAEAGLSFLGLGDPTSKSWGLIMHHAINFAGIYFTPFWKWWLLYPWLALTLMVISLAFISRELEKMADPRMGR
ncbi:peptide/nickel transport system permease protein [Desulfoscipio geothermicus DSM 3669]|uniref:Peptide/nickel transport system permease protein n=1 Tax=Desulfoscipio geothermicus DSM 3669 TaxID=1121426 RepID=A0A1I6D7L6_9FIRM|nr:peptide/nickel transport system permease protein [Desulfoscipio geothermicus DSM 3669]